MNWIDDVFRQLGGLFLGALILCGGLYLATSCFVAPTWEEHEPNSIVELPPAYVSRDYYRTDEDFNNAVQERIEWLEHHNYMVYKICYEYGYDMTRKEKLKFAVLYYREVKNDNK